MAFAGDDRLGTALVLRALLAAVVVVAYVLLRGELDPRALVTARFGVGVALFALLVDVGRSLAGAGDPVQGQLAPHEQVAKPLVDDQYTSVHEPVERYIEQGVWTQRYQRLIEEACRARSVPEATQRGAIDRLREAAHREPVTGPPLALLLVSGSIVILGFALVLGILLEMLALPVTGPVLLCLGVGLGVLQVRARDAGARWTSLAVGLAGATAAGAGAFTLQATHPAAGVPVYGLAAVIAVASVVLFATASPDPSSWRSVERRLEQRFTTLRRAFLAALLAGGVLFPFQPLLEELFDALGWPLDGPYRLLTIGYATLATYVAVEMAATWYGLSRGRERARQQRRRRVEANRALLEVLDRRGPARQLEAPP